MNKEIRELVARAHVYLDNEYSQYPLDMLEVMQGLVDELDEVYFQFEEYKNLTAEYLQNILKTT